MAVECHIYSYAIVNHKNNRFVSLTHDFDLRSKIIFLCLLIEEIVCVIVRLTLWIEKMYSGRMQLVVIVESIRVFGKCATNVLQKRVRTNIILYASIHDNSIIFEKNEDIESWVRTCSRFTQVNRWRHTCFSHWSKAICTTV